MGQLFKRGMLMFHRFVSAFGARGALTFWNLYVGRKGKVVRVSLPMGIRVWVRKRSSDGMVYRQLFLDREADLTLFPQGASVVRKYLEILASARLPLIIDCGANNGMSSIFLASLFPRAIVAAVEPSEDNFKLLAQNVAPLELIKPIRAAVWDTRAHLKILNPQSSPCALRTQEGDEGDPQAIQAITVPDLLERFPDCEPLLIKVDVEGAEHNIFRSNTSWVDKVSLLIVELHDWMFPHVGTSANFLERVSRLGCDFVVRGESVFIFNWAALGDAQDRKSGE